MMIKEEERIDKRDNFVKLNRDPQSHFAKDEKEEFDVDNQVKSTFYIIEKLLKQLEKN